MTTPSEMDAGRPPSELPSRPSLPLLGDTLAFAGDPGGFLARRASELGPVFEVRIFGHPTACFVGPEAFALLLNDDNVERRGANPPHVEEIFDPRAVPFLDGAAQRRRKSLLMHAFRAPAIDGYLPTIEPIVARYAEKWAKLGDFAWVPELDAMGFRIAASLFVGADPSDDDPAVANAFHRVAAGLLSLPIRLPFTPFVKALRARDYLLRTVDRAIDAQSRPGASGGGVLGELMRAREGDDQLTRDELRVETFHFFGAYAAVIGGLSFLMAYLGLSPDVAERARAEVLREAPSGPLSVAVLERLAYLDRVTKEVRRVAPILPITFFGRVKRDLVCHGRRVPAGHRAIGCIGATLLDGDVFADPTRFDPDRWLRAGERQEAAWIPHGGGLHREGHRCAGEALAAVMMKVLAVHMLRDYAWSFPAKQDFSPTKGKLFATPAGGLQVRFARRPASRDALPA